MNRSIYLILLIAPLFLQCQKDQSKIEIEMHDYSAKSAAHFIENSSIRPKVILVNYWATFCSPCKKEIPDLVKLREEYQANQLMIIGACIDPPENKNLIEKISRSLKINYPVLYGITPHFKQEEISGLPVTFILDENRKIVAHVKGKRDYQFFKSKIESLVTARVSAAGTAVAEQGKFYSLKLRAKKITSQKYQLTITLKPEGDYSLNGRGYPPLKVTVLKNQAYQIESTHFEREGIDQNSSYTWQTNMQLKQSRIPQTLELSLDLIACTKESCQLIQKTVRLPLLQ